MNTISVPLSQGLVAVVDETDAAAVLQFKWSAMVKVRTTYAFRSDRNADGSRTTQALHKYLTGFRLTDHINGDGLDNRRSNLRDATVKQNGWNRRRDLDNTSGFKGVSWHARSHKWQSLIRADGVQRFLGYFSIAEEAALAYDVAARELHGPHATINFPRLGERAA